MSSKRTTHKVQTACCIACLPYCNQLEHNSHESALVRNHLAFCTFDGLYRAQRRYKLSDVALELEKEASTEITVLNKQW